MGHAAAVTLLHRARDPFLSEALHVDLLDLPLLTVPRDRTSADTRDDRGVTPELGRTLGLEVPEDGTRGVREVCDAWVPRLESSRRTLGFYQNRLVFLVQR